MTCGLVEMSHNYEHFQANFHQTFLSKHVILDATEVPYTEAKDFNAQRVALSTYTNTHTLKTMASVSASYRGSACDRQIIETHLTQRRHVFTRQIWEL